MDTHGTYQQLQPGVHLHHFIGLKHIRSAIRKFIQTTQMLSGKLNELHTLKALTNLKDILNAYSESIAHFCGYIKEFEKRCARKVHDTESLFYGRQVAWNPGNLMTGPKSCHRLDDPGEKNESRMLAQLKDSKKAKHIALYGSLMTANTHINSIVATNASSSEILLMLQEFWTVWKKIAKYDFVVGRYHVEDIARGKVIPQTSAYIH